MAAVVFEKHIDSEAAVAGTNWIFMRLFVNNLGYDGFQKVVLFSGGMEVWVQFQGMGDLRNEIGGLGYSFLDLG